MRVGVFKTGCLLGVNWVAEGGGEAILAGGGIRDIYSSEDLGKADEEICRCLDYDVDLIGDSAVRGGGTGEGSVIAGGLSRPVKILTAMERYM